MSRNETVAAWVGGIVFFIIMVTMCQKNSDEEVEQKAKERRALVANCRDLCAETGVQKLDEGYAGACTCNARLPR